MDYAVNAETRVLATASKRKLQRVRGAVAKLKVLDPSSNYEKELMRAEEEMTEAHRALMQKLEQVDGGDLLKRTQSEWLEAGGMADYVKRHPNLYPYLPTIEGEQEDARREWDRVQSTKNELRQASCCLLPSRVFRPLPPPLTSSPSSSSCARRRRAWPRGRAPSTHCWSLASSLRAPRWPRLSGVSGRSGRRSSWKPPLSHRSSPRFPRSLHFQPPGRGGEDIAAHAYAGGRAQEAEGAAGRVAGRRVDKFDPQARGGRGARFDFLHTGRHRQQGELKAAERFGEVVGGEVADAVSGRLLRLAIMERDAQHLRAESKAALRALEHAKEVRSHYAFALRPLPAPISPHFPHSPPPSPPSLRLARRMRPPRRSSTCPPAPSRSCRSFPPRPASPHSCTYAGSGSSPE